MVLGSVLLSGVMGLVAVWWEDTFIGLLFSSLLGSVLSSLWAWRAEGSPPGILILALFVFLPRVFFYLPMGMGVIWIISQWERIYLVARRNIGKVIVPLVCMIFSIAAGLFSIYSEDVRFALLQTDQMVQQGLQAERYEDLPEPLKDVWYFENYAKGEYTLEVSYDPDSLPVQRPMVDYGTLEPLIIVRFSNGFMLGCVFSPPKETPVCGNFNH
ncbi:MAG: hypothetical protein FD146_277 [Anaerolineaceae bacterium]|nr:MAG: hypothetical protein FD146_277 [Anaerolineaceae bacterium]